MNLTAIQKAIEDGVQSGAFESEKEAVDYAIQYLRDKAHTGKDHDYLAWKRSELDQAIKEADELGEEGMIPHEEITAFVDSYSLAK